ncbi:urease accessory protein UreF [Pseudomonas sp. R2.Fl]|nr:urease accessory protein UreF [Pseudomonas sp. R2.Fl]
MAIPTDATAGPPASSGADAHQALLRLMAWLSPAFPVGSFAYSAGLERAAADGIVTNGDAVRDWIAASLEAGSARTDALLLSIAHRDHEEAAALSGLAELATALAGSRERHDETLGLGDAFLTAVKAWPDPVLERLPNRAAYPVVVGAVAGAHGVPVEWAMLAFLQAYVAQAVSVAIRLGVIGQVKAVAIQAGAEETLRRLASELKSASLGDLGSATVVAEIEALRHETQAVRLFRS